MPRIWRIGDEWRSIDDLEHPVCRSAALLCHSVQRAQGAQFRRDNPERCDKAQQLAQRHAALRNPPDGETQYAGQSNPARNFQNGVDRGLVRQHFQEQSGALNKALFGAGLLIVFQPIGFDHTGRLKAFRQQGCDLANLFLCSLGPLADAVAQPDHRPEGNRIGDQQQQGQLPVEIQHDAQTAEHGGDGFGEIIGKAQPRIAQGIHIIDEAGDKPARGRRRDPGEIAIGQRIKLARLDVHQPPLDAGIVQHGHQIE